jgi:NADH:ubiquinone oxidoreductase subunit F (NADH-binding)
MTFDHDERRLLAGPPLDGVAEDHHDHLARLGALPSQPCSGASIASLEASGLLGRGGAGFPVGRKWRALAERKGGRAVVVANGAEGEPGSSKDRTLMTHRPHLVIDGAVLAAEAIGADEIVFYVGSEHESALASMGDALEVRRRGIRPLVRLVMAPVGYVAGEASAAVHHINDGDARPTTTPPRISARGVAGRPTLVQNVESLAYAALIARFGEYWYRAAGRLGSRGTALITVSGGIVAPEVREIELGTTIGEIAASIGASSSTRAAVLGGYFGTWVDAADAWDLPLDPAVMKARGLTFGCGIVGLLPVEVCGVTATAEIMAFMADESAGQCGPCFHGLRALGDATKRVADGAAGADEMGHIERWTSEIPGRGACHHPDGAVQLMVSALNVFADEFALHARTGRCSVTGARTAAAEERLGTTGTRITSTGRRIAAA